MGRLARRRRACLPELGKKQLLHWDPDTSNVLELFPETARIEDGELSLGGVRASELANRARHAARSSTASRRSGARCAPTGTPRRARSSSTGRRRSRTSRCCGCSRRRASAPTSPRSASSRSRGRRGFRASGSSSTATTSRTRSCARLRRPARSSSSTRRARRRRRPRPACGRVLVRLTPGVEAVTHRSIQTAHEESKFGLAPDAAEREIERARELGIEVEGLHVHVGSQLARVDESVLALERVARLPRAAAVAAAHPRPRRRARRPPQPRRARCPRSRSSSARSSSGSRTASR